MTEELASIKTPRAFCKAVLRLNPGLTREEFVRMVWTERLRLEKRFKFGALQKNARSVFDGRPLNPRWSPTPGQMREAFKYWNGKPLHFLEAKRISELPVVPARYRGEPLRRALLWLGR